MNYKCSCNYHDWYKNNDNSFITDSDDDSSSYHDSDTDSDY